MGLSIMECKCKIFPEIRGIFDSRRSVTTTSDQVPVRSEQGIDLGSVMQIN